VEPDCGPYLYENPHFPRGLSPRALQPSKQISLPVDLAATVGIMIPDERWWNVKATIVPKRGHLIGKACQAGCRNKIGAGQAVLVKRLDTLHLRTGADPWFVMHVACIQAKCDAAPEGLDPTNTAAAIAAWRRQLLAEGATPARSR